MKIFIPVLLVLTITSSAIAQHWQKVITPWTPVISCYQIPYFLNSNIGFVYSQAPRKNIETSANPYGISTARFYRTTDGGQSWTFVHPFDSTNIAVEQLSFTSLSHGFAVIDSTILDTVYHQAWIMGILYETSDTGNTWKRISPRQMSIYTVYSAHDAIFITAGLPRIFDNSWFNNMGVVPFSEPGKLYKSLDDGSSWNVATEVPGWSVAQVMGNRDNILYLLSVDSATQTYLTYSLNLGRDWITTQLDRFDSNAYTPFVETSIESFPYSCELTRFWDGIDLASTDVISFYTGDFRTSPPVWKKIMTHETGAWVSGTSCAKYLSNAYSSPTPDSGLIRLIGNDTTFAGGPNLLEIDDGDYPNISVVGHGAVVYVSDPWEDQAIWKTTDGGDGKLSEAALAPQLSVSHSLSDGANDSLYICNNGSITIVDQNLSCSRTLFTGFSISGLDSSEYSIARTLHSICDPIPDTTVIFINPIHMGIRSVRIDEHFTDDEFNSLDTGFQVTINAKSGPSIPIHAFLTAASYNPQPGDTLNIPVYLYGSAVLSGATDIALSFIIDTSITKVVGFHPAISGITTGSLSYNSGFENISLHTDRITINGATLIGTLQCIMYITDSLETSVSLASSNLSSSDPQCTGLLTDPGNASITVSGCGTKMISEFLSSGKIPEITLYPNPAANLLQVHIKNFSGALQYELLDALGIQRKKGIASSNAFALDVSELPTGNYYMRISTSTGAPLTRQVVIVK